MEKEETAIILDFLPNGYPLERKMMPIAQALGSKNFTLLELVPRKGENLELGEVVYIGEGKRTKIYYILGRLNPDKITESAKDNLQEVVEKIVQENENKFVDFFNKSQAINKRVHQIELIPGFGKKHMKEILEERERKPFISFAEMKERLQSIPNPEKAIAKRIIEELLQQERQRLFVL